MQLSYILDQLKYGELSNTFLGSTDNLTEDISDEHKVRIYSYIDMALMALNERFHLNQDEIIITLQDGRCNYFINNTEFVKILSVSTDTGKELGINKENTYDTIFNPSYNVVEYSNDPDDANPATRLSVIYLKNFDQVTNATTNIPLNPLLLEALLSYIGYRASMNMATEGENISNLYYNRFENACNRAKDNSTVSIDETYNNKFSTKGFV